jgi:PAS domain S-box-containing protein
MNLARSWNRLSIRLPVLIALFAAVTGIGAGLISYNVAQRSLLDLAKDRMELVRNERARAVTTLIDEMRIGLSSFATRPMLAHDIEGLSAAFEKLDEKQRSGLIGAYTDTSPYPRGSRSALNDAGDGSLYSATHRALHQQFLRMLQIDELDDLLLVDRRGTVVYSVMKEADFGTNFLTGPYRNSNAAAVFRASLVAKRPGEAAFADMQSYEPSGHPALFMSEAVADEHGEIAGVLLFELNNRKLRDVANHVQDLGETGEVYLVGADATRRSQTRFSQGDLLFEKLDTEAAVRAGKGLTGSTISVDYKGDRVVAAYAPVDLMGVRWGIVSKIDLDEALAPLGSMAFATAIGVLAATAVIALLGFATARRISRPLDNSLRVMERLSRGDLDIEIADEGGVIETRQMSAALRTFQGNLRETQRMRLDIEAALAEAKGERSRTEAILAGAPDPIIIVGPDSTIEYVNEQIGRVLGYGRDELIGRKIECLLPPRVRVGHRSLVRGFFEAGTVRVMGEGRELFALAKDGREVPVEIALSPIRVGNKPVVVALMRDITERKKAAEALRRSEQLLSGVIQNSKLVIFVKRHGRYIMVNKAWEEMTGVSAEQAKDRTDFEIFNADAAKKFTDNDAAVMASRKLAEVEEPAVVHGKVIHFLSVKFPLFNEAGEVDGVCGMSSDITDRIAAEKAVREARDAAEAATKAKSDFLASMSHEIRTPMNGITGMADILAQTTLDDEQKHMVRTIRESGNALITVINDILDFSKIEAGKLDLESVTMSIGGAVEGAAATLAPAAAKRAVAIHVFVDPRLPDFVHGDPTRLRQILFNLGGNAVKFSNGNDVQIRAVPSTKSDDGRTWIRFTVIDRGIGISAENQAKLFQAFSQAETSTTRRFGGTGLGLAICKRLVDMMGGAIGVESLEGAGSTFWAELPFKSAPDAKSNRKERDLHDLRVLLVGSEPPRREAIEAYLQDSGADVIAVPDAAAALAALKAASATKIDSVMLDLGLDGGRQESAIRDIRKSTGEMTPLIVLQDYQNRGARIPSADIVTVDANPLVRYRLSSAVAVAAGRASPQIKSEAEAITYAPVKPPTVAEARALGQLILLAEDNATNRDVIARQLKLLGYTCEFAADGKEALKAYKSGDYALLLTDCHMPEMDGYELTDTIRKLEHGTGRRLPIIAVTANALQGEAERCLAAGMDDYISKPIAMPALVSALKRWMPPPQSPVAHRPASGRSVIDDRAIKDSFGDDDATFKEILVSFVEPSQTIISEIAIASEKRAAKAVKDGAHKLKSAARSVGANALADICVALEAAGKTEDWATIDTLTPKAREEFVEVKAYIDAL